MLRSYRGILIALAGIAALAWAFSSGLTFGALNYPQQERYQSYRYASDKPLEIESTPIGKSDAKPLEYRVPCSEPKGSGESELCAQWKAARAAEAGALWAKFGVWATVAGIIGLLVTIVQTRVALDRARDANDIAMDSIEGQQRPWVDFEVFRDGILEIVDDNIEIEAVVKFKNIGQSPAIDLSYFATMCFGEDLNNDIKLLVDGFDTPDIDWSDKNLFHGDEWTRNVGAIHSGDRPGKVVVRFYVMVRYRTPFSKKYRFTARAFDVQRCARDQLGCLGTTGPTIDLRKYPIGRDVVWLHECQHFAGCAT